MHRFDGATLMSALGRKQSLAGARAAQCQFPLRTCKLPVHRARITMGILAWLVLGLIAGFIGSKIVNKSGEGLILDIVLGIVGAIVGG